MAVRIQEPSDLPEGSITDQTADNYEILVYQKASDGAGIKKMGIAPWKTYLGFNQHKVNNVASYIGMPEDYNWEVDADNPYPDADMTISKQLETLQTKLGINTEPATFNPLYPRFTTVETDVDTLKNEVETAATGLLDRTTTVEGKVQTLEGVVGSGDTGLVGDVTTLQSNVGNLQTGVSALQSTTSGLVEVVGDNTTGLVKQVNDLDFTVNGDDTTDGLTTRVANIERTIVGVYKYIGKIVRVDDATTTTEIYVSNGSGAATPITVSTLNNGNVFDIGPETGDVLIINGKTYTKGTNIVYTVPTSGSPFFDELGTTIDVQRLDNLETDVARLDSYYWTENVNMSWTSATSGKIKNGIFQFSCISRIAGSTALSSFILPFDIDGIPMISTPADVSGNFDTYWEFAGNVVKPKIVSSLTINKVSIHKIGEI